jgi:predicted dehydrogenase
VDLLERSSEIVRMRTVEGDGAPFGVTIDLGNGKGRRGISFEKPEIAPGNAIRDELRAFTLSVLNDTPTEVPLEDGRRAMEVAFRILECMRAHATATPTY